MKNLEFIKGFTLIELLVVIAVIGMILSFVFVQLKETKTKSRDATREANMKEIQNALNLYAGSASLFPVCGDNEIVINGKTDCLSDALAVEGAMSAAPTDPIGGADGTSCGGDRYVYCYESANGKSYTLRYKLETNSIPGKSAGWQTATP